MATKLVVIIDGRHLLDATRALGFAVDFKLFRKYLEGLGELVRCYYVIGVDGTKDHQTMRPLLDWLDYNGFTLVENPNISALEISANFAITAFAAIEMAEEMMLVARDVQHAPLVRLIQSKGVRVSVLSTIIAEKVRVSDALRRAADEFIDLDSIKQHFLRTS